MNPYYYLVFGISDRKICTSKYTEPHRIAHQFYQLKCASIEYTVNRSANRK